MSGGGRSGGSRGSGRPGAWEEAGSEFYQESYPGADFDLDPFNKDPNYFTTLLPSKQNRATVKRPKGDTKATFKRRNSGYYSTMGNNTVPNEIHCAMMPDLSQNLATEESTWEEIMLIKSMPVNMAQKKEIKAKLLSAEIFRLQGFQQFKWRRRKMWEKVKAKNKEYGKKLDLWRSCIRTVRGNFGTGVATYFSFIKWLMLLNFLLAHILIFFILLPTLVFDKEYEGICFPLNETASVACCKEKYFDKWTNETTEWDLAVGSGWLEHTVLLYGYYPSIIITYTKKYDMRIAYIGAWTTCLILSLFWIIRKGFRRLKLRLVEKQGGCYKYCNLVFSGWDFCLYSEKGKEGRHRALRSQIVNWFEEDEDYEKRWGRSIGRFCAKLVAAGVIAAQGAILWFAFDTSFKFKCEGVWAVLLGYLPSGTAALAHAVIPSLVKCLAPYSCLTRSAAPRLATIAALLGAFYFVVHCKPDFEKCYEPCPSCWETLFGQHVSRLIASEIVMLTMVTFLLDLPRSFCSRKSPFCNQEFQLPQHVCHLLYFQVLVFLASFHAPFLPSAATFIFLFLFYLKKFSCLINSTPSATLYWASCSKSLYIILMLICYFIAVIPWIYSLINVVPSQSCGPYSGFNSIYVFLSIFYVGLPHWLQTGFRYLMSPVVTLPVIFLISFVLYYYFIIARANQDLVIMLKKQLILEGHDKQFLLNRLSALIKQHQERHKPRSIDPPPPPPPNVANSS